MDGVARELLEEIGIETDVVRLGWFDLPEATNLAMCSVMQLRIADLAEIDGIRFRSCMTAPFLLIHEGR